MRRPAPAVFYNILNGERLLSRPFIGFLLDELWLLNLGLGRIIKCASVSSNSTEEQ